MEYLWSHEVAQNFSFIRCMAVSYTHLRAHETLRYLVCRLLLEKNLSSVFGGVKGQSTYKGVALVYFIV